MSNDERRTKVIHPRLSERTYERLGEWARRERRSMAASVELLVERGLAAEAPNRVPCDECPEPATTISVLTDEVRTYRKYRLHLADPNVPLKEKIVWDFDGDLPPAPAHWHVTCDEHYPGDDVVHYWGRIRDERALVVGTLRHITEKGWVNEDTGIVSLAVRLLAPAEARLSRWVTG